MNHETWWDAIIFSINLRNLTPWPTKKNFFFQFPPPLVGRSVMGFLVLALDWK